MKLLLRLVGILLVVMGVLLIAGHATVYDWSASLVEERVLHGSRLSPEHMTKLSRFMYEAAILVILCGLASLVASTAFVSARVKLFADQMTQVIPEEHLSNPEADHGRALFVIASLGAVFLMAFYYISAYYLTEETWFRIYSEDNVFETISTIFLALAGILFVVAAVRLRSWANEQNKDPNVGYATIVWAYVGLGILMFFCVGEEISYGQRILGWNAPDTLTAINQQKEINLHNLFNQWFRVVYLVPIGLLILTSISVWFWYRQLRPRVYSLLLPHRSLIIAGIVVAVVCVLTLFAPMSDHMSKELEEEVVYYFLFCYSLAILIYPTIAVSRAKGG